MRSYPKFYAILSDALTANSRMCKFGMCIITSHHNQKCVDAYTPLMLTVDGLPVWTICYVCERFLFVLAASHSCCPQNMSECFCCITAGTLGRLFCLYYLYTSPEQVRSVKHRGCLGMCIVHCMHTAQHNGWCVDAWRLAMLTVRGV